MTNKLLNKQNILSISSFILVKAVLSIIYLYQIVPIFQYEGYKLNFSATYAIIENIGFVSVIFCIHAILKSEFYHFVLNLVILFFLIPNGILFYMLSGDIRVILSMYIFVVILLISSQVKYKFCFSSLLVSQRTFLIFVLCIVFFIILFLMFRFEISFKVLILQDIYETRANTVDDKTGFLGYLFSLAASTIFPIGLIYGLVYRKYLIVYIASLASVYLFLATGHKSIFFGIFISIYLYYVGSTVYKKYLLNFHLIVFLMLCWVMNIILNINLFVSLFARRIFFTPALLNIYYFDYFQENYLFWKFSLFKFFSNPNEIYRVDKRIAAIYFNRPNMAANNGIISDGFANMGMIGVLINILIVALIIKFLADSNISRNVYGILFRIIFVFLSSFMFVSLLTHGIFVLIVLTTLLFRDSGNSEIKAFINV